MRRVLISTEKGHAEKISSLEKKLFELQSNKNIAYMDSLRKTSPHTSPNSQPKTIRVTLSPRGEVNTVELEQQHVLSKRQHSPLQNEKPQDIITPPLLDKHDRIDKLSVDYNSSWISA